MPLSVFAPAKINLFLAITGRRGDGFHELISLVAPLEWGDTLTLDGRPNATADSLECSDPEVPADASNLVLKAAAAYRKRGGSGAPFVHFILKKEIPHGAGLGGGSSDAAAALRGLNQLAPQPLNANDLRACAAEVGSDVPLFLENSAIIMRGRGEVVEVLSNAARDALRGRELIVFKPPFGIATAWAYGRLRERGADWYVPAAAAENTMGAWLGGPTWATLPLENNLEYPAFEKYTALPVLLDELRQRFQLRCRMSGSGSACFALLEPGAPRAAIIETIRMAWGPHAVIRATRIAG
ncbi:MAG TPA: 4-(cytidine 5'-diphospho)-2-C-methyl-D-erythritol kinase [Opitutales bacterium]|jgi:4-diphosphocytidyl-2-C-methyl-D-erythritol kinase|nr:4-(cytidine 5'-diphospho)-2-C-methyl-D-erythritol kinase [Opitutales bacterium]